MLMALVMKSLDPAYFDDRLHYSYIENPAETRGTGNDREYKDDAIVRVTNTGSTSIQISSAMVDGPFVVQSPAKLVGAVIAPGASIDVTVAFDRAAYAAPTGTLGRIDNTSTVFEGKLTLNAGGGQSASVDMSGFWQLYPEKNMEPNLNEIWQVFGFGNEIENLPFAGSGGRSVLSNDGVYEALDETEVLSPYWRIADGYSAMTITQIAAYHGPGGAPVQIHAPGDTAQAQRLWRGAADDNQQLLPNAGVSATEFATKTVSSIPAAWGADGAFALWVANFSSDPSLNAVGDHLVDVNGVRYRIRDETTARDENGVIYQIADLDLAQQGHWLRIFQAVDKNGAVIPNVYLAAMDYSGVNSDFNDNLFIIEGVTPIAVDGAPPIGGEAPVEGVATLSIAGFDPAAADERIVFSKVTVPDKSAETTALGGQEFRDEATITLTNGGSAALKILGLTLDGSGAGDFEIVSAPASIAAGRSAEVVVRFTGVDPETDRVSVRFDAVLTVRTDAAQNAVQTIDLVGMAQRRSELGQELTVADIVAGFGYTTDVAQDQLRNKGVVETVGDEVLAPYFQRLDSGKPVEIIQMAAFLGQNDVARLGFHSLGSADTTFLFAQDDQQGQTVSPRGHVAGPGDTGQVARGVINSDAPFGVHIAVDGRPTFAGWSDPFANRADPVLSDIVAPDAGHLIRYFVARDAGGAVIPGTYIGLQDYAGGTNFDYNDHVFLIRNVTPHALSSAEDRDRNGVNDALETDSNGNGVVDFFDFTAPPESGPPPSSPPSGQFAATDTGAPWLVASDAAFSIHAGKFDFGGEGVAYSDTTAKVLGDASIRPDAGVDFSIHTGAVGFTRAGEWLEYTLNVANAGDYALSFLAATPNDNRAITASFEKNGAFYETAVSTLSNTGDFTVFTESAAETVRLQAGEQVMRVAFGAGGQDLHDITLVAVDLLV